MNSIPHSNTPIVSNDDINEAVEWLDETYENWRIRIKWSQLDMSNYDIWDDSGCGCIMHFQIRKKDVKLDTVTSFKALGFFQDFSDQDYKELTVIWKKWHASTSFIP